MNLKSLVCPEYTNSMAQDLTVTLAAATISSWPRPLVVIHQSVHRRESSKIINHMKIKMFQLSLKFSHVILHIPIILRPDLADSSNIPPCEPILGLTSIPVLDQNFPDKPILALLQAVHHAQV